MPDTENNITKLLRAWLAGVQDIENALQQLLTMRFIDTAVGVQLDVLGNIVGQGRDGLVDATYRRYIRARISANRSKGTIADAIRVADLVVYDDASYLNVRNYGRASYALIVEDIIIDNYDVIQALIMFLRAASSAGVRPIAETWPLAEASLFVLGGDGTTGDGAVGLGLGNTLDAADGGGLASARD